MRILLISDIHGNFQALSAIQESFDVCICLGDLVEYGPQPSECIDWVKANCHYVVRGNHDHGLVQNVKVRAVSGFRYLTKTTRDVTADLITTEQRNYLKQLPVSLQISLAGKKYLLVHASPRDPLEEYVTPEVSLWRERTNHLQIQYLTVGHTHQQYALQVNDITVINPGSVGLPRDGDPRARYALITDDHFELKQIDYPIEKTIDQLMKLDLEPISKEILKNVYRVGRYINPPELAAHPTRSTMPPPVSGKSPSHFSLRLS